MTIWKLTPWIKLVHTPLFSSFIILKNFCYLRSCPTGWCMIVWLSTKTYCVKLACFFPLSLNSFFFFKSLILRERWQNRKVKNESQVGHSISFSNMTMLCVCSNKVCSIFFNRYTSRMSLWKTENVGIGLFVSSKY